MALSTGGRSVAMFTWATEGTCADSTGTPRFQLGHNDETNTCPRHVSTTDFKTYLGFVADAVIAMKDEASKKKLKVEDLNLRPSIEAGIPRLSSFVRRTMVRSTCSVVPRASFAR